MLHSHFHDRASGARYALLEPTDQDRPLLELLRGKDRLYAHGVGTIEALSTFRIGGPGYAKSAFVLASLDHTEVYAVIYGLKIADPIESPTDYPGDIEHVLNQHAKTPFPDTPTLNAFYSISSYKKGRGPCLMQAYLNWEERPLARNVTLSPFTALAELFLQMDAAELTNDHTAALSYLYLTNPRAQKISDMAQNLHMADGGATIADIKTSGGRSMINYEYSNDAAERKHNKELFHSIANGDVPADRISELVHPVLHRRIQGMNGAIPDLERLLHTPGKAGIPPLSSRL